MAENHEPWAGEGSQPVLKINGRDNKKEYVHHWLFALIYFNYWYTNTVL